jgi:hypothetical protein
MFGGAVIVYAVAEKECYPLPLPPLSSLSSLSSLLSHPSSLPSKAWNRKKGLTSWRSRGNSGRAVSSLFLSPVFTLSSLSLHSLFTLSSLSLHSLFSLSHLPGKGSEPQEGTHTVEIKGKSWSCRTTCVGALPSCKAEPKENYYGWDMEREERERGRGRGRGREREREGEGEGEGEGREREERVGKGERR